MPSRELYRDSLGLLTDLYQLTMAYGYWKSGAAEREAAFHLFFREEPFAGGYAVSCGLAQVVELLERFELAADDLAYLETLRGNDDRPLFERAFLDALAATPLRLDVDAVPEGTVVFAHEPLLRVTGPLMQCQLLETALLNIVNFQTLVATKAARVTGAAGDDPVLEFGLRRAQGIDGGLAASRAAFIGGCAGTSNVLAGKLYDIPVRGTHAHSWIMAFGDELAAFTAYAEAMPNNCIFLVDTYDTIEGVRNAVTVGAALRARGHEMVGIRLDSGDLAALSIEARRILDEAGFPDAKIVASNDLDEHLISELKGKGATIGVWGVGTKLATAYDQPALGGVYKLAAIREPGAAWQYRVKLSEQAIKISNPGLQQVRRYLHEGGRGLYADVIYDIDQGAGDGPVAIDPMDPANPIPIPAESPYHDLLVPVFRAGDRVYDPPAAATARRHARLEVAGLAAESRRLAAPQPPRVGLAAPLYELRERLISEARGARGRS